jgi:hypothetical protein
LNLLLSPKHKALLSEMAEAEGITRTALIERWIDEHAAALPPEPPEPPGPPTTPPAQALE